MLWISQSQLLSAFVVAAEAPSSQSVGEFASAVDLGT